MAPKKTTTKLDPAEAEKVIKTKLKPIENSITATNDAIRMLEEKTQEAMNNMEASFSSKITDFKNEILKALADSTNVKSVEVTEAIEINASTS